VFGSLDALILKSLHVAYLVHPVIQLHVHFNHFVMELLESLNKWLPKVELKDSGLLYRLFLLTEVFFIFDIVTKTALHFVDGISLACLDTHLPVLADVVRSHFVYFFTTVIVLILSNAFVNLLASCIRLNAHKSPLSLSELHFFLGYLFCFGSDS